MIATLGPNRNGGVWKNINKPLASAMKICIEWKIYCKLLKGQACLLLQLFQHLLKISDANNQIFLKLYFDLYPGGEGMYHTT